MSLGHNVDIRKVIINDRHKLIIGRYSGTGDIDEIDIDDETYWCFGSKQFINHERMEQYENGTPLEVWRKEDNEHRPENTGVVIQIISIGGRNPEDTRIPSIPPHFCNHIVKVRRIR